MLMPSIFGENLFDDWMDDFESYPHGEERHSAYKI